MQFSIFIPLFFLTCELLVKSVSEDIDTQPAKITEFPYLASIRAKSTMKQFCSGAIINVKYVITAARCIRDQPIKYTEMIVVVGTAEPNGKGDEHDIEIVHIHPEYTGKISVKEVLIRNIAIVTVKNEIAFSVTKRKIEFSKTEVKNKDSGMVAGWGMLQYDSNAPPDPFSKASIHILDSLRCSNLMKHIVHSGQICAYKPKGSGLYPGDLGGPLISDGKIVGVCSYMSRTSKNDPTIYTSIHASLIFIKSVVIK